MLAIMVVNGREVQNRILQLERYYSADELRRASNYLNMEFRGKELSAVREHLLAQLKETREHLNEMMLDAIHLAQQVVNEFCTLNRGTAQDRGETRIGNDNWVMAYVHIAHDCVIGDNTILANGATLAGHVIVGDWAILGGFTKVHQFCHIGAHSFCGMDTGLNQDLPPYVTASGMPAKPVGINSEGLKRRNFSAEQILNIKRAYRTIYRSGLRLQEACTELQAMAADNPEVRLFLDFIEKSDRGIIR